MSGWSLKTRTAEDDVYQWSDNGFELMSTGPSDDGTSTAWRFTVSEDGARVIFETPATLSPDDTDGGSQDVYERHAGETTLLSKGAVGGFGAFDAAFHAINRDATHMFCYATRGASGCR